MEDFEAQARQALANLSTVLTNAGSNLADTVKATVFVTDVTRLNVSAGLRAEHFTDKPREGLRVRAGQRLLRRCGLTVLRYEIRGAAAVTRR